MSPNLKLVGMLPLIFSLYFYLRQYALLSFSHSVVSLKFTNTLQCTLKMVNDQMMDCVILNSTFVSPYLTVLILQPLDRGYKRTVVIMPDAVEAEEFRRLRILLRWKWKQVSDPNL